VVRHIRAAAHGPASAAPQLRCGTPAFAAPRLRRGGQEQLVAKMVAILEQAALPSAALAPDVVRASCP
jgi:hypothetical protein